MQERYKPTGTPLTSYEQELLVVLMEECAEVIQAASKLVRFGKEAYPGYGDNIEVLSKEVGDLLYMLEQASEAGLTKANHVLIGKLRKQDRLKQFMQADQV